MTTAKVEITKVGATRVVQLTCANMRLQMTRDEALGIAELLIKAAAMMRDDPEPR
jgi:hypothetical protein